ncbi:MAG: hypothetical protein A2X86_08040 [Bdellovibrionales bacterium GWA2_49_15]|nr:MAG: hypothetical protein A2X86_08040 [Bdellovibrionales bacterium GWA2_49_15]HAZ11771.1 hypothetical protein [Bdellovibrionales bacterium]
MSANKIFYSLFFLVLAFASAESFAQSAPRKYGVQRYQSRERNPISENVNKREFGLPGKVDLMKNQTAVKDQDQRGTCAYFAASAQVESEIKRVTKTEVNLSEEYLIRYGKGVLGDFANDDGANSFTVLQTFKTAGFALERDLPYQPDWFDIGLPCEGIRKESTEAAKKGCFSHHAPTAEMQAGAIKLNGLTTRKINEYDDSLVDTLKAVLAKEGTTTLVTIPVNFNGWDKKTGNAYHSDALKKECDKNPDDCGTHAVLLVGYDDNLEATYDGKTVQGAFIFKNSWGHGWGKGGFGKFPYEMIQNWGYRASFSKLNEDFKLPLGAEASAPVPAKIENISYSHEIDADGNLLSMVSAKVTGAPNVMIYVSTFVTDEERTILKHDDTYIRAPYYQLLNHEGVATLDKAIMKINKNTWDDVLATLLPAFLRVSLYVLTDIDSSTILTREFIAL